MVHRGPRFSSLSVRVVSHFLLGVILLTLLGCSTLERRYGESCKSRAYLRMPIADFISRRYPSNSPVRIAVIPFSVPANLAGKSVDEPSLGLRLATQLHSELIRPGELPLVEVLNREDWPRKKEEFFTGNFGAIQQARAAGYDLFVIGFVPEMTRRDALSAQVKVIEAESGITLYYGTVEAETNRPAWNDWAYTLHLTGRRSDLLSMQPMMAKLARCVADEVLSEYPVP